jgi:hypothetical protein
MRVGGLFYRTNPRITFGRNKNFLIGPNGSGKTTIVHILASCLRNDFTQLFDLPFRTAEITLTGTASPKETKVTVTKRFNTTSGQRIINFTITGDYQHSEDIELRSTQQLPAWAVDDDDDQSVASTTAGLGQIVRSLTNTTWLSVHRGEIRQPDPVGQNLVDRHLDSISRRFAQFNSRRNTLLGRENTEFQRRMFLSFLTPRISLATLRSLASLDIDQRIQQLREILRQLGARAPEAEANLSRYHDDLERAVSASKQRRQGRMGFNEEATLLSVSQANDVISSWSESLLSGQ